MGKIMNKSNQTGQNGFAMVVALSFLVLMTLVATGVLAFGQQQMHAARRTRDYLKAKVIAETGLNVAFNDIRGDIERVANYTGAEAEFGDGTYAATIEKVGESGDENVRFLRITSIGRCGISEARATLAVRHSIVGGTENSDLDIVLHNAVTCASAVTLSGSIYIEGDAASAVAIKINGNSAAVTGSAYSPSFSGNSAVVAGTIADDPSRYAVNWGAVLEIDKFLEHAVTHDGRAWSSYPPNTIVYCPGNVNISGSFNFQCMVIAVGDIKMTGAITLLQPGDYPALVSLTGSVRMGGTAVAHGLVAALGGTVTHSGTGAIYGSVLSSGEFKESGNWSIFFSPLDIRPPDAPENSDIVEVVAWQ